MRFGSVFSQSAPKAASVAACLLTGDMSVADDIAPLPLTQIEDAQISAQDTVTWLGFRVFDIAVFTPNGARYDPTEPAAIELKYARKFSKKSLTTATMEEFDRLEGTQTDHPQIARKLQTCFADVGPGDRFLAIGAARDRVSLFRNNRQTCRLTHPNIRARFLDIWLSLDSRFPAVSRRLRGL